MSEHDTKILKFLKKLLVPALVYGKDGRFLQVNDSWIKLTGYDQEDLANMTLQEWIVIEHDGHDRLSLLNNLNGDQFYTIYPKSGEKLKIKLVSYPIGGIEDMAVGVIIAEDIVKTHMIDKLEEEDPVHYHTLVKASYEAILIHSMEEGRITDYNEHAYKMFGDLLKKENLVLEDVTQTNTIEGNITKLLDEEFQKAKAKGFTRFKWKVVDKHNTMIPVEIRLVHFRSAGNSWMRIMIIDSKEQYEVEKKLTQLNEELQRSNYDLEQFAYVASHDLQEPLRVIHGFVELLEKDLESKLDEDTTYMFAAIKRASTRMQRLIDDLLKFSRVGKNDYSEEVDLNSIMQLIEDNLQDTMKQRQVILEYDQLPTIKANYTEIGQLFQNIITNAIKFNTNKPKIQVKYKDLGDTHYLQFIDNGIGIDKGYHDEIFTIFKRLHNKKDYPGTGLGLALCKKIVNNLQGDIWITNPENGIGSIFHVHFPKIVEN